MRIRWRNWTSGRQNRARIASRVIALLSAFVLGLGFAAATATTAQAATPGIAIDVLHNGSALQDGDVVPEGDPLVLRVQYDAAEDIAGKEIVLTLPANIDAGSFPNNEAIESIVQNDDGTITITFKDPLPSGVTEGVLAINLTAGEVDGNTESPISWRIDDDQGGVDIVIENVEEPPVEVEDGAAKSVSPSNLDGFVQTSGSPDYEFTGLSDDLLGQELTYTLTLDSAEARAGYAITDTLPDYFSIVPDSYSATLTANGETNPFAFAPTTATDGSGFTGSVDVPEQSQLVITYKVKVTDQAALGELEDLLREQYEARNDRPGNYQILRTNTASFGTDYERTADVRLRGSIPGVGVGELFDKTGNWTLQDVVTDEDGNLVPAAEMNYELKADLSAWDGRNPNFTLQQNVVISDELIEQASWVTGDDFISVTGDGPITSLTEASGFTGTAVEFAHDDYVGQWAIVDNTLLINVGKNDPANPTDITIHAKAQLDTIDGLTETDTTVQGGTGYEWNNTASFYYGGSNPATHDHDATVVDMPDDRDGGVNDSSAFNKTADNGEVRVNPGETAQVPYTFRIDTSKPNIDALNFRIIDELDTDVFDVSDLASTPISGDYGGQAMSSEHFVVGLNDDGNVEIVLSEAGKELVGNADPDQVLTINVAFTTVAFEGKETFEIYNRASLLSEGSEWDYWSDINSEATSYGDEAEMRKRIYNEVSEDWVADLDAAIEGGEFVNDLFVYSIELIPRGNYGQDVPVKIFTREDVLPDAVDFRGFVTLDENGVPSLDGASSDDVDMNGNVVASYADGVVTVQQRADTNLDPNDGRIVVYFAVQANDASQVIVNTIAGSETTITPKGDPSIDIEKWNDEGEAPEYDETGALLNDGYAGDFDEAPGKQLEAGELVDIHFTVSNDGREALTQVKVSDELVSGKGAIENLVCVFPDESTGTEWDGPFAIGEQFQCTGQLPAMLAGDTHANTAKVTAVGEFTGIEVDDEDSWNSFVPKSDDEGSKGDDDGTSSTTKGPDSDNDSDLSVTGAGSPYWIAAGALLLLLAGGATMLLRRRGGSAMSDATE
ncbi:hypothetical protein [Leucobacter sp. GX24907]